MSKLDQLQGLLSRKKSRDYYAKRLGISRIEVDDLINQLRARRPTEDFDEENSITENLESGTLRATKVVSERPTTPEEIIQIHGIDPTKWRLSQFWSKQKKDKWIVSALFTAIRLNENLGLQKDLILNEIKVYMEALTLDKPRSSTYPGSSAGQDCLLEVCLPDLHFGKLAHKDEVGEDYDIKIASERANKAVDELIKRVNTTTVERILFPIGNDLFNADNQLGTTTAGTRQDCDTRLHKMVKTTVRVLIAQIDKLVGIAPVDIPVVVGNHDTILAFMAGEILEAYYHLHPDVKVYNSADKRKYYKYYDNGFQFTHGNEEPIKELGIIFAAEEPRLWADTKFRYCQIGHFHKEKKIEFLTGDSFQGFQVEILPSLSGPDSWHHGKGYISNKAAKAFLYHRTNGEIGAYKYTVTAE